MNEGEKTLKFFCGPDLKSEKRKLVCQVAKVNKILASVAGICDGDNEVTFRKKNGFIKNLKTGLITWFRRHGNIYLMDAYIPNPEFITEDEDAEMALDNVESPVFSRPGDR